MHNPAFKQRQLWKENRYCNSTKSYQVQYTYIDIMSCSGSIIQCTILLRVWIDRALWDILAKREWLCPESGSPCAGGQNEHLAETPIYSHGAMDGSHGHFSCPPLHTCIWCHIYCALKVVQSLTLQCSSCWCLQTVPGQWQAHALTSGGKVFGRLLRAYTTRMKVLTALPGHNFAP